MSGLRELKKARTRKLISDVATRLFIERGYHAVTVDEIAREAEVSVPTLFKYFQNKESLVFDEDEEREQRLLSAVKEREKGTSVLDAIYALCLKSPMMQPKYRKEARGFLQLIKSTPELQSHWRASWAKSEGALAMLLVQDATAEVQQVEAEAIAHYILDCLNRATQAKDPKGALNRLFALLKTGWNG